MGWVRFGGGLLVWCAEALGSCSPVCTLCVWSCVYGVLGPLAPVHRCARSVCGGVCTVSWASWLLCTGVHALGVVLRVRCPGPPGSCSPVRTPCVWCCVYGVLGLLAPVHRCARSACGVACTASWASWLLFTGAHALRVVLRVQRPGPSGSRSPVCTFCVWCCVYGVLGLLAPVHRCARSVCGVACTVSWASWLLFTGVHALCMVLRVRRPGPPGSCSPVCTFCVWCCVYGVLGFLAPVHRCARSVCCVARTVSWASWLLFTGAHALRVVLCVRCPGPPGSCSPVCTLCAWCCVYGVLGLLAPVHRCARPACGVVCTVSWASRLLFTGAHALRVVLRVRRPGPPGQCSPVCTPCVWCCVYRVLGSLAPVHRCARPACGVVCTVSWASRLLFTGVHALCVVLHVRCPGPPGSCSPVCTLCVWCCVYGVLGLLAPVHRCARCVRGVACTASWAYWLLFTGVHAPRVVLRVRCLGPPGSCSPVCTLCVWCCVYGVLGLLAPAHRCARSVCGVACTVSWASWLLFTGVHVLCVVLCVRCPGLPGSCSPVRTLCVWCCVYGVLGLLAPVHRCARSVSGVACTVSWASWLLFTVVHVLCVVLCVRCPGPPGSCSPVRTLCVWCCVYGVLGLLAPVHRCAHSVCGVACTVSWASWLLFTGVHALCVVLRVRCPGLPGSCSPVRTPCVWCCVYGVLGLPVPVHRCARSVRGVARTVSWASWLLFTGAHALRVVLCVRCPGPPGSCSPVRTLCVWCCVYGVLGLLAPVHRCARSVCGVACTVSWASWLLFTGVHALCVVLRVRCPGLPGPCSPVRTPCVWCCVYGVLGFLAPVHRCARSVCCVACTVSWASWLLFTGAHALRVVLCVRCPGPPGSVHRCARSACGVACTASWASWPLFTGVHALCVVLRVPCPGLPGSCSPVRTPCVWCCVYGVLGLPAPVHRCARSVCGVACTVSWASWLLFTGVHALRVVLCVWCPGPPGSCSPVCTLCAWCCVYGVLGLLAPVHRCARSARGVACTVSWASWLLFTGVHALRVVLRVRRPGPPGSRSPVCTFCVWCCVYGVLGLLATVHRCARSVCGVACTVSWASWLLFTGVHALRVVLRVRRPGPPGSCSLVRTFCVWCCVYSVLGLLAPVHRCARSVCRVARTVSWASWLLFTNAHALRMVLCVRCPGPPGSCSQVCTLCVWCCVYGVLGLLAPVHRCARSACGVVCTVSSASWLLFTGVHALCVVLRVRRPGPPGSCSPVCTLRAWCCVYGVFGLLAPVHRCARSVCGVACTVSLASWLLFTGVHVLCVVLRVRCPGPPSSCSPVCTPCVWCCVYGILGLLAPVHRCAHSVCGVACTVSWASWLLFTGVHALCVVLRVRCPGPPGSCSPVRTPCVWCCVYGVLGLLAPVHRCARSVRGVARTVSWASWLLFTGAHALRVLLCVRCPGPPGSCSPLRTLCVWCCVYGVLGLLAPVHRCARSVCGVACTASWASWPLFTGVHALCVVLRVRCPGLPGSCSPVRTPCVWCCVYGVLGLPAPVHRCARSVCGVACTVSWASWLLFTGVHALRVVLCVRCPGLPGSCSPVRTLCVWCWVYDVLGLLAPVHRCAGSVCGVACTASWASWLLFTGVHALSLVLRVRCPGPPGSCSPICTLCVWCCVYGVLGLLAPVHRCERSACGVVCTASWASWLLFTGVHAPRVVLRVRCLRPPGSCSPMCTLCACCCVYGVPGLLAPVHRCPRSVCGVACTASWASWLLFTGVHALCVVLRVRCPGPSGSCSPVCTLCVWCCVYGVLGLLAPVHRCARSVRGVACTASWAPWLLFTGVQALCVVLRVRRPGPPGSCLPVCTLFLWCCVYGVLGLLAPVHRCARSACGAVCTVSWASWLLFTGVHALRVVLRVRCPGPPGSCSPVCTLCVWCCVYGVLALLAPVHRCVRSVCGVARTASWAS